MSSFFAGAEMMTFFAPAVEVALGLLGVGEEAGGFDDDIDAEFLPRERGGTFLDRETFDLWPSTTSMSSSASDGSDFSLRDRAA